MSALHKIDQLIESLATNDEAVKTTDIDMSDEKQENNTINLDTKEKYHIFVSLSYTPSIEQTITLLKQAGHTICTVDGKLKSAEAKESYIKELENANNKYAAMLVVGGDKMCGNEYLSMMPNLKVISTISAGFNHIDIDYCNKHKIHVLNTSPALTECVADFTVGLTISTARLFFENNKELREIGSKYQWNAIKGCGKNVFGKTIGIFGFGSIAYHVAKRFYYGFGCQIIYHSRNEKNEINKQFNAKYVTFEQLLKQSDFVIVLASLNENTKYKFDENAFKMMKNDGIFINVSRGQLCDSNALIKALNNNWIYAAGLDVFDPEPIPKDHAIWNCKNVVITPHIGSATFETRQLMLDTAVKNMIDALNQRQSTNYVTDF